MSDVQDWIQKLPGLALLEDGLRKDMLAHARIVQLPAGSRIFGPGQAPENFLLLIEGAIRVQQVSENGREIVLYRILPGETCTLTTACLLSFEDYVAEAIAEADSRALVIPRATFDALISRSPEFRRFIFTAFSERVTGLFRIIEEVAFARLDIRLAERILAMAKGSDHISITQQQLASELGSAREVISRLLNDFQRRGWLTISRGGLVIKNREAMAALSQQC